MLYCGRRMLIKHGLLLILFSTQITFNNALKKKKMVIVARILKHFVCPEYENTVARVVWSKLENQGRGTQVLHQNVSVLADLPPEIKILGIGHKCKTIADESCEPFLRGTVDGCRAFMDKGKFYSKLFDYKPPFRCPIKKGMYILRNATYIGPALEKFLKFIPPEYYQYYWNIRVKFFAPKNPQKILYCAENMFRVSQVREN